MNEDAKCNIKSSIILPCCKEESKCNECLPQWKRKVLMDDTGSLWFPIIGMTNKVLKKLAKSEFRVLVDRANGIWYIEEQLALETADNKEEYAILLVRCKELKDKYESYIAQAQS